MWWLSVLKIFHLNESFRQFDSVFDRYTVCCHRSNSARIRGAVKEDFFIVQSIPRVPIRPGNCYFFFGKQQVSFLGASIFLQKLHRSFENVYIMLHPAEPRGRSKRYVPLTTFTYFCFKRAACCQGYRTLSLYKNALMFITTVGVPFLIKLRWPRVEKRKFWELGREIRQQSKMRSFNFGSEYIKWTDESFPKVDSSGSVFNDPSDLRALSICPNWSARPFPLFPSQWQFPF